MLQSVGEKLRQRRDARGLSHEAVSRATRLTRAVLLALEEDRFGDIAAPVYVRGFLRIYAQHLEMDADPLLEAYEQQSQAAQPAADAVQPGQLPDYLRAGARPSRSMSGAQLFALAAAAAVVVMFLWNMNRKRPVLLANRPSIQAPAATATGPADTEPKPTAPGKHGPAAIKSLPAVR